MRLRLAWEPSGLVMVYYTQGKAMFGRATDLPLAL
jgi:hypothetical protein